MHFIVCLIALALLTLSPMARAADIQHVIVIVMENKDATQSLPGRGGFIYDNMTEAPFINTVLARRGSRSSNFIDELPGAVSLPHYILLEAGTTKFEDAIFTCDHAPLHPCKAGGVDWHKNWTNSNSHLTAQIEATLRLTWMTYQGGVSAGLNGACPVHSGGLYAAKHNPFIYFSDVSGDPPNPSNAHCASHVRSLDEFEKDVQSGVLANYVFISPDLCDDMHGAPACPNSSIAEGDAFLENLLRPLLVWSETHQAIVFVVWDESRHTSRLPFIAVGYGIKQGYTSGVKVSHRSVLKTIEKIFDLPILEAVRSANDLSGMFTLGSLSRGEQE